MEHIGLVVAYCARDELKGREMFPTARILLLPLIAVMFSLPMAGQGCPHAGLDHRLLGRPGCWIQRKLTIESAEPPSKIWSLHPGKFSVKIDPKHPHLLIEWPTSSGELWRFRVGYRWDANARAYIFPAMALKKVGQAMEEYQSNEFSRTLSLAE